MNSIYLRSSPNSFIKKVSLSPLSYLSFYFFILFSLLSISIETQATDKIERDPFEKKLKFKKVTPEVQVETTSEEKKPVLKLQRYQLKHISSKKLNDILTTGHGKGFISSFGSLTIDPMSNSLIVKDSQIVLTQLSQIIHFVDKPSQQIIIEARIVNFDDGALEEFGTSWQLQAEHNNWSSPNKRKKKEKSDENLNNEIQLPINGTNFAIPTAPSLALNLSGLGGLSTLIDLDVTLSAYESEAKAEVLSRPRLMATNQQTSIIEQGTEIPYSQQDKNGSVSTSFKKANLSLEVTPQILSHGKIELFLRLTQDKPGETVHTGIGEAVSISTQRIETQITALSGTTVMLGGIYQTTDTKIVDKVPLLGDIPLLGLLFQHSYKKKSKRELIIFLTPTIVSI